MEPNFSFKELYDVVFRFTCPVSIGGRDYEEGEVALRFDKIQIAGLQEVKERTSANGGFDNRPHVFWETTKELDLSFSQGVFSKKHLAFLSNSQFNSNVKGCYISRIEEKESDVNGIITLDFPPAKNLFIYNKETGERIRNFTTTSSDFREKKLSESFLEVIVEYQYEYKNSDVLLVGRRFLPNFLEVEGKTKIKEEGTGRITTGLIKIPHFRLESDLYFNLGQQANPVVAKFSGFGCPVGERHSSYVSEFYFLNNDIDADIN